MNGVMPLVSWLLGLLLLFVGERVVGPGSAVRTGVDVLAVLSLLLGLGSRLRLWLGSDGDTRAAISRLVPAWVASAIALVVYAFVATGSPAEVGEGDGRVVLTLAFVVLLLLSGLPLVLMEASLLSMRGARHMELRRMTESGRAGLALGLAVALLGFANYTGSEKDHKFDLRTFRNLVPSQATIEMVRNLDQPLTITLFFPPANDVARSIEPYFEDLAAASPQVTIERVDRDMQPRKAKEMRARENGTVVVSVGSKHESITLAEKPEKARGKLKKLDGDFQKALAKATKDESIAYFVTGHGERSTSPSADDPPGLKVAKDLLQQMSFKVKKLGPRDGLGNQVPDDATVVFLVAPTMPMLEAELSSLVDWVKGGGALFVLVDPEVEQDPQLGPLLEVLGLDVVPGVLTHDRQYFPFRGAVSDRTFLMTNRFSSHDSTTVLTRISSQVAVFLDSASALKKRDGVLPAAEGGPDVQFTVRSVAGTWADLDGDLEFGKETEKKDVYQMVAAVQLKPEQEGGRGGRAIVGSDADMAGDLILARSKGNLQWIHDAVRWLQDDVVLIGEVADIEDVPIEHTKEGEALWFWATTFGVPFVVVGLALGLTTRGRRNAA